MAKDVEIVSISTQVWRVAPPCQLPMRYSEQLPTRLSAYAVWPYAADMYRAIAAGSTMSLDRRRTLSGSPLCLSALVQAR